MDTAPTNGKPDPTDRTNEGLAREIAHLQELLQAKIEGSVAIADEKFLRIEHDLKRMEENRLEQKKDTKDAVDAALTAQKEAVKEQTTASERAIAKSEASTKEQLNQQQTTFKTESDGHRREIDDLKTRVTTVEQQKVGAKEDRSGLYALAAFAATILAIAGTVIAFVK